MPRMLSPMLPSLGERAFIAPELAVRAQAGRLSRDGHRGRRRRPADSRRGLDCSAEYPWLVEALKAQPYRDAIFDGEIVALDEHGRPVVPAHAEPRPGAAPVPAVLRLRPAVSRRLRPARRAARAAQGASLAQQPDSRRDRLRVVETFPEHGVALFDAVQKSGMEGIVAKRRDSRYETGKRTDAWLKIKATHSDEFVVGGYTVGSGSRAKTFGSLVVGYYKPTALQADLRRPRRLGLRRPDPGQPARAPASAADRRVAVRRRGADVGRWTRPGKAEGPITWVRPELVAQVKYAERTSDGILRAPVFLGLRDDKAARDVGESVVAPPRQVRQVTPPEAPVDVVEQLAQHTGETLILNVDGHDIAFSNLNKVFWPAHGEQRALTKRDLVRLLRPRGAVPAAASARSAADAGPLPERHHGEHFYQKHWEQPLPPFVETVLAVLGPQQGRRRVPARSTTCRRCCGWARSPTSSCTPGTRGSTRRRRRRAADDVRRLAREHAAVGARTTPTSWCSTWTRTCTRARKHAAPSRSCTPKASRRPARWRCGSRRCSTSLGLASFVKTTGKTGLHIYVPIVRTLDYHATHSISETLAQLPGPAAPEGSDHRVGGRQAQGQSLRRLQPERARQDAGVDLLAAGAAVGGGVDAAALGRSGQGVSRPISRF